MDRPVSLGAPVAATYHHLLPERLPSSRLSHFARFPMKLPMLRWRSRNPVGLDIDASAVRMVQVRKDRDGYVIVKAGVVDIAPWGNDPQLHRIHTVRAIADGLARYGIRNKFAVCGLRGPEVVVRDFEFPALSPEEIPGAVELEVSQICPFLAEESTRDSQVTSAGGPRTRGFWVAATNGLIKDTRRLVAEAGLRCALVDVTGLALLNLVECTGKRKEFQVQTSDNRRPGSDSDNSPAESGAPRQRSCPAVLNLGDSCATVAIADPTGRPFVRDIGGSTPVDSRTSLVAAREGAQGSLSAEEGWAARDDYPLAKNGLPDDSLAEEVATTLRYYAAQNGSVKVDRLLVCGGPASAEYLPSLRTRLNIDVKRWNPLVEGGFWVEDNGEEETGEDLPASARRRLQSDGSSLAVATGLALRSI